LQIQHFNEFSNLYDANEKYYVKNIGDNENAMLDLEYVTCVTKMNNIIHQ